MYMFQVVVMKMHDIVGRACLEIINLVKTIHLIN